MDSASEPETDRQKLIKCCFLFNENEIRIAIYWENSVQIVIIKSYGKWDNISGFNTCKRN